MLACAYFHNTFTFSTITSTPSTKPKDLAPDHSDRSFVYFSSPPPQQKKTVSSNNRNNCFNHTPPISMDFSATTFVSKYSAARWNNNPRKCTKSQHNLFLSNPSLHVSVSVQPPSRPAKAQIHMFLSAVRACSAFTYMTAQKSDALRQKWKPASTSLSPLFSLSQTVTLSHTRPCAVPGCLAGSYRSEI